MLLRTHLITSFGLLCASLVACLATEKGDRAATGACPAGEVCSEATPMGLLFTGQFFFDDEEAVRLGPVLVGGEFELGLSVHGSGQFPNYEARVDDEQTFTAEVGTGVFGPTNDAGEPIYNIDNHLVLRGVSPGNTRVRIVNPDTGELFDRLTMDVYRLDHIEARNVRRDGEPLLAGCPNMVGFSLIASNDVDEIRAVDNSISATATGGTMNDEPRFWDCQIATPDENATEMMFTVRAGGQSHDLPLPVETLEDAELTECPVIRD